MQAVRVFNSDIPIMGREGRVNQIVSNDDTTVDPDEDDPEEVHPPQAPPHPHTPTDLPTHSPKKELPSVFYAFWCCHRVELDVPLCACVCRMTRRSWMMSCRTRRRKSSMETPQTSQSTDADRL